MDGGGDDGAVFVVEEGDGSAYSKQSTADPAILLLSRGEPSSLMGRLATPRGEGSSSWRLLAMSRISSMELEGNDIFFCGNCNG